ncbi:MAG: LPS export ABC transporter permease LptG [Desulfobacterium sp.]|nr:LPS export ABC transporter permease LptG [Desulfobacterium sp.]
MSILHRYWLKEFVKFFLVVQLAILCIFVAVDYLSNMDEFLNSSITLMGALGYVLLKLPFMFVQLTPAAIVLAVIVVFGLMNKNNELLALKGSGVSVYYLVKPAAAVGVVLAVMMFFLGETLVPVTMARANYLKYSVIRNDQRLYMAREDIWIKSGRTIAHFKYFDPSDKALKGITLTFFDDDFKMKTRVDAEKGTYENGEWVFSNLLEQIFDKASGESIVNFHDSKAFALDLLPEDLKAVAKKSDEMSFTDLAAYVKKVEGEGYDATTYRVDLYGKTAFPFICLIMAITGAATGMRSAIKERMPLGIGIGICVSFLYWIIYGFCTSLGYGKMLPPLVSAWAANLFFICFSLIYLINTE